MQRFSPNEGNAEKEALDKAIGMSATPLLYEHASDEHRSFNHLIINVF